MYRCTVGSNKGAAGRITTFACVCVCGALFYFFLGKEGPYFRLLDRHENRDNFVSFGTAFFLSFFQKWRRSKVFVSLPFWPTRAIT